MQPIEATYNVRRICCIGAGYVGGPTSAVIADQCPDITVTIADIDAERIKRWNQGPRLPIFEPGLEEIVKRCRNRNLFFSTEVYKAIQEADIIFVSVNTPTKKCGLGAGMASDLCYIESATRAILQASKSSKIIVEKSTVPCKTAEIMDTILNSKSNTSQIRFDILSNPEFLAEGTAINDLLYPDRILIGSFPDEYGQKAQQTLMQIYTRWVPKEKIITMSLWSSEISKLAANAMLAQRISSINALSQICEVTGADVDEVAMAVGLDSRIGSKFLKASVGFGGSCFQKDILSLVYISESLKLKEVADYWNQVLKINEFQKQRFVKNIIEKMFHTITNKKIAIFGFAFKKNTGDTRETAALTVVDRLLIEGAYVAIYDPAVEQDQIFEDIKGLELGKKYIDNISIHSSPYDAATCADAVVICTEWDEFRQLDYQHIYSIMRKPSFIFDGRLILESKKLRNIGFTVEILGKG